MGLGPILGEQRVKALLNEPDSSFSRTPDYRREWSVFDLYKHSQMTDVAYELRLIATIGLGLSLIFRVDYAATLFFSSRLAISAAVRLDLLQLPGLLVRREKRRSSFPSQNEDDDKDDESKGGDHNQALQANKNAY